MKITQTISDGSLMLPNFMIADPEATRRICANASDHPLFSLAWSSLEIPSKSDYKLGWFVGYVESSGKTYAFACLPKGKDARAASRRHNFPEESLGQHKGELRRISEPKNKEKFMEIGQKVVFVRDVKGAEVGRHGKVMEVSNNTVLVRCSLREQTAPVVAKIWDVLPERLWNHLSRRVVAAGYDRRSRS